MRICFYICRGRRAQQHAEQERQHIQSLTDVIARHSRTTVANALNRRRKEEHGEHVRTNLMAAMCVLQRPATAVATAAVAAVVVSTTTPAVTETTVVTTAARWTAMPALMWVTRREDWAASLVAAAEMQLTTATAAPRQAAATAQLENAEVAVGACRLLHVVVTVLSTAQTRVWMRLLGQASMPLVAGF